MLLPPFHLRLSLRSTILRHQKDLVPTATPYSLSSRPRCFQLPSNNLVPQFEIPPYRLSRLACWHPLHTFEPSPYSSAEVPGATTVPEQPKHNPALGLVPQSLREPSVTRAEAELWEKMFYSNELRKIVREGYMGD